MLNIHSDTVIGITQSDKSNIQVIDQLRKYSKIGLIGQNVISEEIFLIHHVEKISGGIGSSFTAFVGLQGFGLRATAAQLKVDLFNDYFDIKCPVEENLWNAGSIEEFSNLSPTRGDVLRTVHFRPLVALPLFLQTH